MTEVDVVRVMNALGVLLAPRGCDQIADNIDDAVDLMEKQGRIRGAGSSSKGYCPTGALLQVVGMDPNDWGLAFGMPERLAIEQRLPDLGYGQRTLWSFSDSNPCDQVVFDLMRRTAKELRDYGIQEA